MGDLVIQPEFQHILRMLNTNIDGRTSVQYALTAIGYWQKILRSDMQKS